MKTIVTIIITLLIFSCQNIVRPKQNVGKTFKHQLVEVKGGWQYTIVTFKGHEYITNSNSGGITHTESCKCKLNNHENNSNQ